MLAPADGGPPGPPGPAGPPNEGGGGGAATAVPIATPVPIRTPVPMIGPMPGAARRTDRPVGPRRTGAAGTGFGRLFADHGGPTGLRGGTRIFLPGLLGLAIAICDPLVRGTLTLRGMTARWVVKEPLFMLNAATAALRRGFVGGEQGNGRGERRERQAADAMERVEAGAWLCLRSGVRNVQFDRQDAGFAAPFFVCLLRGGHGQTDHRVALHPLDDGAELALRQRLVGDAQAEHARCRTPGRRPRWPCALRGTC